MNYASFVKKVTNSIKKEVLDKRVDETDVYQRPFRKRFLLSLEEKTMSLTDEEKRSLSSKELLRIYDSCYRTSNSEINLYEVYVMVKNREISTEKAIEDITDRVEKKVQELVYSGQHYYDAINRQEAFDKEHGLPTDYSRWE